MSGPSSLLCLACEALPAATLRQGDLTKQAAHMRQRRNNFWEWDCLLLSFTLCTVLRFRCDKTNELNIFRLNFNADFCVV